MSDSRPPNRLAKETSPYLLQHAQNPVDWYPWGDEALARARREDKPILLSIGYSACHWCHVMEHESFEDEATAAVMNGLFICIKVDREERPDLDKIYQTAHQILMQRPGGWPLNMFLDPRDHMPIFGGTYFPKESRHGLPAFTELLKRVADFYHQNRSDIDSQNRSLAALFRQMEAIAPQDDELDEGLITQARDELSKQFDARHGGFGQAPKFPHPTTLELLLRLGASGRQQREAGPQARHMVQLTLLAMSAGGLYDQVGGGFFRYSVDERWEIPHFEKMLYDNGQLLGLYAQAAIALKEPTYARVARETGEWMLREMRAPAGGFYATLDADSEDEEGSFYTWGHEQMHELLSPREWAVMQLRYRLDAAPNFEGRWHLHTQADLETVAGELGMEIEEAADLLENAHHKLFAARLVRPRPGRDEKILTAWNALAIKGLARTGRLLERPDFITAAEQAVDFVHSHLWRDGRLLASYKDGQARLPAYLDDHVFLMDALLELLQARWRASDLVFLIELAEIVLDRFMDEDKGGFFFTASDHETLVYRPKPDADEATPSGNGVAAFVLQRLGHLLGEPRYLKAAENTLRAMHRAMAGYPSAHGSLLMALDEYLAPAQTIVLRGQAPALTAWRHRAQYRFVPGRLAIAIPADDHELPGLLAQRTHRGGEATAYLCEGHACREPITAFDDLEAQLTSGEDRSGQVR